MHDPRYYGGVVKVGIVWIRILKGPATAFEMRAIISPVTGFIGQLALLEPIQCAQKVVCWFAAGYFQ